MSDVLPSIAEAINRFSTILERLIIKDGPYKDHLMVAVNSPGIEVAIENIKASSGNTPVNLTIPIPPLQEEFRIPSGYESFEVTTTWRNEALPRTTEVFDNEHAARAVFNGKRQKHVFVEMTRIVRQQLATYTG